MQNLSKLIEDFIADTFRVTGTSPYEGYTKDYWYVVKGASRDLYIGFKTHYPEVNKCLVEEVGLYLYENCESKLRYINTVEGEFSDYSDEIVSFLSGSDTVLSKKLCH